MGNRVLIIAVGRYGAAPVVYGHWIGSEAPALLVAAGEVGILRRGDAGYTAARICGFLHEQDPRDTCGLGLLPPPADLTDDGIAAFSHGDAGVILLNVEDGSLSYIGGYLAKDDSAPRIVKMSA